MVRTLRSLALLSGLAVLVSCSSGGPLGSWSPAGGPDFLRVFSLVELESGSLLIAGPYFHAQNDCTYDGYYIDPGILRLNRYDPVTGAWTKTPPTAGMGAHTATLLADGRVLLVGGGIGDGAGAALWDPGQDAWISAAAAPPRFGHQAALLGDGTVLVVGGVAVAGERAMDDDVWGTADRYDPVADAWLPRPYPGQPRLRSALVALPDGRALAVGGERVDGSPTTQIELFDPATNTFSPAPSMHHARAGAAATRMPDGTVLVTGGGVKQVERYDPIAQVWTEEGELRSPWGSAVALPDGRVFVAGYTAELYDPASGKTADAGGPERYYIPALAVLPGGRVLVLGGCSESVIYTPPPAR